MGSGYGQAARGGSSKSLIEDEADLSDWVSGLNSNSFKKTRVYSDSDNDENGKESEGFRGREGGGKRRRESEFDKDSDFTGRRGGAGRRSNEAFPGRRKNVNESNGSLFGGRGRGSDTSEFRKDGKFGGRGRGSDTSEFRRDRKFGGLSEGKRERNDGFSSRRNEGKREKRQSERGLGVRGGGRGGDQGGLAIKREGKGMERRGFLVTDDEDMEEEEETDKGYMSFKELIDTDETDEDSVEEEEQEEEEASVESEKLIFSSKFPQSSPQKSDSYLSGTR